MNEKLRIIIFFTGIFVIPISSVYIKKLVVSYYGITEWYLDFVVFIIIAIPILTVGVLIMKKLHIFDSIQQSTTSVNDEGKS